MADLSTGRPARTITDPDEASSVLEDAYAPNSLTMVGRAAKLQLRLATTRLPLVDVSALEMSGDIRMEAPPPRVCCVVMSPRRGGVTISAGGETVQLSPGKAVFLPPGPSISYEDCGPVTDVTTLRIGNSVLSAHHPWGAERILHELAGPILVDLRTDGARALSWVMRLLSEEMRRPSGSLTTGLVAEHLSALALSSVLSAVGPDVEVQSSARSRILRRALVAVEAQQYDVPSISNLARAAAVSVRTLQGVFRTELQLTPTAYLRLVRLRRAHEELLRGDSSRTTTEAVAHRWGFTNYGRFTRLYRAQYGMSPSATLRRQ
jgi:AraC-like DNA-binding protein